MTLTIEELKYGAEIGDLGIDAVRAVCAEALANGEKEGYINRTDFERALLLSGITDFRFHDLRHTWASWHVQNGTPLMVLKELGGWEKLEMVNKYAHLSGEHLSKFSGIVTFLAQDTESTNDAVRISLVS